MRVCAWRYVLVYSVYAATYYGFHPGSPRLQTLILDYVMTALYWMNCSLQHPDFTGTVEWFDNFLNISEIGHVCN